MPTFLVANLKKGYLTLWMTSKKKKLGAYSYYKLNFRDPVPCSRCLGSLHRARGELGTSEKPVCWDQDCLEHASERLRAQRGDTAHLQPAPFLGSWSLWHPHDTFYLTTCRKSGACRAIGACWTSAYWLRCVCFSSLVRGRGLQHMTHKCCWKRQK